QAEEFLSQFKAQLASAEECGFFFPNECTAEIQKFVPKALSFIHQEFFGGKETLSRKNREDFIAIFYQPLILKLIEMLQADSMSFTCKDAIDTGAAQNGLFFGMLHLLNGQIEEELDFMRWLFYMPALFVRERAIDPERLQRSVSALE